MACRGQAQNGELAYGPAGKKSSANPDKVYALEGVHTHQVACGIGHTLFLVKPGSKQVSSLVMSEVSLCAQLMCILLMSTVDMRDWDSIPLPGCRPALGL